MNENIDLIEILKDCPKGTALYCALYGNVVFESIFSESVQNWIEVRLPNNAIVSFNSKGVPGNIKYAGIGICTLFPSEDQRDWSKFKLPVERFDPKTLKPFEKVLARMGDGGDWSIELFERFEDGRAICMMNYVNQCIPYKEDTECLLGTSNDCPEFYKWWEE